MRNYRFIDALVPSNRKWVNDQDLEVPDVTNNQVSVVLAFPPRDELSFYAQGRNNPDSEVPEGSHPLYEATVVRSESEWRRVTELHVAPRLFPDTGDEKHYFGRVFQAGLSNFYLIQALQALSLRPLLLKEMFAVVNLEKAIFVLMFFKNGQYCAVEVDDYVPATANGELLLASERVIGVVF